MSRLPQMGAGKFETLYERNIDLDTSGLLSHLCRAFLRSDEYVEVDLRALLPEVKAGDQHTHHMHSYPGRLLPAIAHLFTQANCLFSDSRSVLDPFCGSGTVALEASLAGRTAYVADANPLALLITRAKTTPYDVSELGENLSNVLRAARRSRSAPTVPVVNENLWFNPLQKRRLDRLAQSVSEAEHFTKDFFMACLSVTVRKVSYADPRVSVPVRLRKKKKFTRKTNARISERLAWLDAVSAIDEFERICLANLERVRKTNVAHPFRRSAVVAGVDVRALAPNESVDLILTSPPYGSAQKYVRASSLSLNILGLAKPEELAELEAKSIGREHLPAMRASLLVDQDELDEEFESLIRLISTINPIRSALLRAYLSEMRDALTSLSNASSPTGRVVMVVGNNSVCGHALHNDKYIVLVMKKLGWVLELGMVDKIRSRGLMTKRNKTASVITQEVILMFCKKGVLHVS